MSTLKIVVRVAAFAGLLFLWSGDAKASGCCTKDCDDAYGTMLASGVNTKDATEWYRGCLSDCAAHGDPSTCPKDLMMAAQNEIPEEPAADVCDDTALPASPQPAVAAAPWPIQRPAI